MELEEGWRSHCRGTSFQGIRKAVMSSVSLDSNSFEIKRCEGTGSERNCRCRRLHRHFRHCRRRRHFRHRRRGCRDRRDCRRPKLPKPRLSGNLNSLPVISPHLTSWSSSKTFRASLRVFARCSAAARAAIVVPPQCRLAAVATLPPLPPRRRDYHVAVRRRGRRRRSSGSWLLWSSVIFSSVIDVSRNQGVGALDLQFQLLQPRC